MPGIGHQPPGTRYHPRVPRRTEAQSVLDTLVYASVRLSVCRCARLLIVYVHASACLRVCGCVATQPTPHFPLSLPYTYSQSSAFDPWICDRNITLGLNMSTLGKILKCAGNDDSVTLRSEDATDSLTFLFETKG